VLGKGRPSLSAHTPPEYSKGPPVRDGLCYQHGEGSRYLPVLALGGLALGWVLKPSSPAATARVGQRFAHRNITGDLQRVSHAEHLLISSTANLRAGGEEMGQQDATRSGLRTC
jgi:hypothetical protein